MHKKQLAKFSIPQKGSMEQMFLCPLLKRFATQVLFHIWHHVWGICPIIDTLRFYYRYIIICIRSRFLIWHFHGNDGCISLQLLITCYLFWSCVHLKLYCMDYDVGLYFLNQQMKKMYRTFMSTLSSCLKRGLVFKGLQLCFFKPL